MRQISIKPVTYPVAGSFRIARSTVTEVKVVQIDITQTGITGRGECRPYARYGDTTQSVIAQIDDIKSDLEAGLSLEALQEALPAGPARNAVDCALWDLRAKQQKRPVHELAGITAPKPRITAYTLSVDTPDNMANAARKAKAYPVLKLKIKGMAGLEACLRVMQTRPDAQLIIDANESLDLTDLAQLQSVLRENPVLCIEQPIPAGHDKTLPIDVSGLPVLCADESMHSSKDLQTLWDSGYRAVNVKLDKTGGFSQGLATMRAAKSMGFVIMAGCMVGSSLAMAPMMTLSGFADIIDLDGPLLLAQDIDRGLTYSGPKILPPQPALWG